MKHLFTLAVTLFASSTAGATDLNQVEFRCTFSSSALKTDVLREDEKGRVGLPYSKMLYRVELGEVNQIELEEVDGVIFSREEKRMAVIQKGFLDAMGDFITTSVRMIPVTKSRQNIQGVSRVEYRSEFFALSVLENQINDETRVFFEDGGLEVSAVGSCSAVE